MEGARGHDDVARFDGSAARFQAQPAGGPIEGRQPRDVDAERDRRRDDLGVASHPRDELVTSHESVRIRSFVVETKQAGAPVR